MLHSLGQFIVIFASFLRFCLFLEKGKEGEREGEKENQCVVS